MLHAGVRCNCLPAWIGGFIVVRVLHSISIIAGEASDCSARHVFVEISKAGDWSKKCAQA